MKGRLILVYGTLKEGYWNHRCIEHPTTKALGDFTTEPDYTLLDGGFPVVEREGNTSITGELYEVNDESILQSVYNLEGYRGTPHSPDNWYDVDSIPTPYGVAEMFVMEKGKSGRNKIVKTGIWKK